MRDNRLNMAGKRTYRYKTENFANGIDLSKDEEIMPLSYAKYSYNFDFSGGTLKEGYGLKDTEYNMPNATNVWVYRRFDEESGYEDILMYSNNLGFVYHLKNGVFVKIDAVELNGVPLIINYKLYGVDSILICSDVDHMYVWDGLVAYQVTDSPLITSMAMHFERLFVTIGGAKNAVWFSDDLDPTNWSTDLNEGGFIELADERGRLNKVISFLNYVYIFRDYGISRLSAYASQVDFSVSNLFISSGKIYPNTVTLCGDEVIFLAEDGLYSFDGLSTVKILPKIADLMEPSNGAYGVNHNGKYYLSFRLKPDESIVGNESETYANNGLLVLDLKNGSYCISRGFDLKKIVSLTIGYSNRIFGIERTGRFGEILKNGIYYDIPLKKVWRSPLTDLGVNDKTKHIKDIIIDTLYDIDFTLLTDKGNKTFLIKGKRGISTVNVNMSADKIGYEIVSNTALAKISTPTRVTTR